MMIKKNQIINGTCIDYTYDGLGIVKNDTFCIFVKGMLIGETGNIVVTLVKNNYAYGRLLQLDVISNERVEPECLCAKSCGGCHLLHMSKNEQAHFKKNYVQSVIRNIAKIDNEINDVITMKVKDGYRNKIMLPVGIDRNGKLAVGFYRYNSHEIIPIKDCLLQSHKANNIVEKIKELIIKYHLEKEIRHIMLRDMPKTNEVMVVIVTYKQRVNFLKNLVDELIKFENSIVSVIQNINSENTNVVLGKQDIVLYGKNFIIDELAGLKFKIAAHSFYQVNTYQTEVLYSKAIELVQLDKEDMVLDLYCGVGTIGLFASRYVKKVIGVEIVADAIENAKENAKINNINNAEFICGDAKIVAKDLLERGNKFEAIFVDPPRKGCSIETIDTLLSFNANKIVYISCNPATLARDLAILKKDYVIESITPVDMFPNTYHCETIALLVRK